MAVPVAIGVAAIAVLYAGKRYFQGPRCQSTRSLKGKTVVITGANTGMGKETAVHLAARGARVIIGCRNLEKGRKALKEIQEQSGNKNIFLEKLDLASLESVRAFADKVVNSEPRLDILINNAGVAACAYQKTEDGFEMQFGVNHLGHFLLTMLLLDRLKHSQPSRIINVASAVHRMGKIKFDDIHHEKSYSRYGAYFDSKLANVLFTRELSKHLAGTHVTVNAVHPGVVGTENLLQHHSVLPSALSYPITWYFLKTPEQGIQTTIHCAVSEDMDGVSGKYLKDCAIVEPSKGAQDDVAAKKLWEVSMNLVGLEK